MAVTLQNFHKYCIYCGTQYEANDIEEFAFKCSACKRSHYINPTLGVGGLCFYENKLLLIKRVKDPYKNTWDIPAGFVDVKDGSVEDALRREVLEETGFQINNLEYHSSTSMEYEFQGIVKPHMSLFYTCKVQITKDFVENTEVSAIKFLETKNIDISEIGFPEVKDLIAGLK